MTEAREKPHPLAASIALILTTVLGILPSVAFFAWIERGGTLPVIPLWLGWPWVAFWDWPLPARLAWDAGLIALFGFIHSATAQPTFYRNVLGPMIPEAFHRAAYLCVTGLTVIALMGLWQSSGIVAWSLPLPEPAIRILSLAGFWIPCAVMGFLVIRHDGLAFLGLRPLLSALRLARPGSSQREHPGSPQSEHPGSTDLITTGIYGVVRHPIYTFTLLAMVLAPVMTLDRLLVLAMSSVYLAFGIPVEERKLVARFGGRYLEYRRRVPAVIPGFRSGALSQRRQAR